MSGLHVGIIMDGNGRWARQQGKPRWRGHFAGVETVRRMVKSAPDLGIATLTLYAFSADNWKRPAGEVGRLFWLMRQYCAQERKELTETGVKTTAIGRRDRIPRSALRELERLEQSTAGGRRLHMRLAIDYSSQVEIARAANRLATEGGEITRERMDGLLCNGSRPVDLLIRTAGEQRLSDFLLWECAYAELYYTDVLWPDFAGADLATAVSAFQGRERRFGG
ncbi:MAG: polyprenyl diphosphate synthase, partial [Gemmatimonadales bacterium]